MDLARPFGVITPTVDGDVLQVLAGAEASFTPPQVHRLIGAHSESGVRKSLLRLCGQGIVTRARTGRAWAYRLSREHLAAPSIRSLAGLRQQLFDRVGAETRRWKIRAAYTAVFGSAASGRMRPDSDIDLFVVRPDEINFEDEAWRDQIEAIEHQVTAWTGNDCRVLELSEDEVAVAARSGDERVLADIADHGVTLTGPALYLRRLLRSA